jgi:WD40 repeat protein
MKKILLFTLLFVLSGCSLVIKPECSSGTLIAYNGSANPVFVVKDMGNNNAPLQTIKTGEPSTFRAIDYKNGKFIYTEAGSGDMFYYDLKTKVLKKFIREKYGWLAGPHFSPDGTHVVVARWIGDSMSQLYVFDVETLLGTPLFDMVDGVNYIPIAWEEKGILFNKFTESSDEYMWLDPKTGKTVPTTSSLKAVLSPDNSTWLQSDYETKRFTLLSDATGKTTILWDIPESAFAPAWSPDGKCIAYSLKDKVYIYSLTTKLTNEIELPKPKYDYNVVWGE